jgi:hypothetical protein
MKAVLIDPAAKKVSAIDVQPTGSRLVNKYFGEKPIEVLKLPRGDVLLAAEAEEGDAFVLGGSRPIGGPGLIVGRKLGAGKRGSALVELDHIVKMVRWTNIETSKNVDLRNKVRAIEIDPERRSVKELLIAPTVLALQHRLGGELKQCFRAPGGDLVLSATVAPPAVWEWQKDDATFNGRCIVVGHHSRSGRFADVAASVDNLRESVSFRGPHEREWASYKEQRSRDLPELL